MATPWTQSLSLRWRPALSFYATRIAILEELDNAKVLRAFRVGDEQIDARILAGHELSVSQNGLSLEVFGPDADVDEVWAYVDQAVRKVAPAQMGGAATQFQHIAPIDMPYDAAIAAATASYLPPLANEIVDWAVIVNLPGGLGNMPANRGPSVEFGIINEGEARMRLSRVGSRTTSRMQQSQLPGSRWESTTFPAVALFADSTWPQHVSPAGVESLADVREYLDATKEQAGRFVDHLYENITIER